MYTQDDIDIELNDEQKLHIETEYNKAVEGKWKFDWSPNVLGECLEAFKAVKTTIQTPGRWSYNKETIYHIGSRYFMLIEEKPNTEMQEGGSFQHYLYEVVPQEVRTIIYKKLDNGK